MKWRRHQRGEFSGKLENVGLKTMRIRADSGEQIVMGNAELLKNAVRNFMRMSACGVQFSLMADPSTPPALARKLPDVLRKIVERQDEVRFDRAHLKKVTQEAFEFELVFYVLDAGYGKFMDAQQAILLEAMEAFEEMGVSIGASARHLVLERRAGKHAGRGQAAFGGRDADVAAPCTLSDIASRVVRAPTCVTQR